MRLLSLKWKKVQNMIVMNVITGHYTEPQYSEIQIKSWLAWLREWHRSYPLPSHGRITSKYTVRPFSEINELLQKYSLWTLQDTIKWSCARSFELFALYAIYIHIQYKYRQVPPPPLTDKWWLTFIIHLSHWSMW